MSTEENHSPSLGKVHPKGRCKCLDVIRNKLADYHGIKADDICLELKQTINTETLDIGTALPPLYYSYLKGKRRKRSYITFNFCPFCGRKSTD